MAAHASVHRLEVASLLTRVLNEQASIKMMLTKVSSSLPCQPGTNDRVMWRG